MYSLTYVFLVVVAGVTSGLPVQVLEKKIASHTASTAKSGTPVGFVYKTILPSGVIRDAYDGKCDKDGFYSNGPYSFVICSNGKAYVHSCINGSKIVSKHLDGKHYTYTDFCNEKLNGSYGEKRDFTPPSRGYGFGGGGF